MLLLSFSITGFEAIAGAVPKAIMSFGKYGATPVPYTAEIPDITIEVNGVCVNCKGMQKTGRTNPLPAVSGVPQFAGL